MALEHGGGGKAFRRPSNRGRSYSYVRDGLEITAIWPSKVNRNQSPEAKERQEFFRQVQIAFKYNFALQQRDYTEAVKGTPLLPRDLWTAAQYGRLLNIRTPEGGLIVSVASMSNVSETLDFISSVPGSMLLRGPDGWVGLAPGDTGDVLTMQAVTGLPAWAVGGGGGGGGTNPIPAPAPGSLTMNTTVNWATAGIYNMSDVWPQIDQTANRVLMPVATPDTNAFFRPVLYHWASQASLPQSTLGATLVATGPERQIAGRAIHAFDFDAPATLLAGEIYLIGMFKRASTTNTAVLPTVINRRNYNGGVAAPVPPPTLPALGQSNNTANSFWTE